MAKVSELSGCEADRQVGTGPCPLPQHTLARWKQQLVGPKEHLRVIEEQPTRVIWRVVGPQDDRGRRVVVSRGQGDSVWLKGFQRCS
jgi:hypothetical protein